MSKRADLKEWTVCECHDQPIKRVNLPTHMRSVKRSERKRIEREKKEKGWFGRMIDRLMGHGSKGEAQNLRTIADNLENQGE